MEARKNDATQQTSKDDQIKRIEAICQNIQSLENMKEIEALSSEIQELLEETAATITDLNRSISAIEGRQAFRITERESIESMRQDRKGLLNDGNRLRQCLHKVNGRLFELEKVA